MGSLRRSDLALYVILDRTASHGRALREILDGVIAGGGRLVQFREKEWPLRRCLPLLEDLRRRARQAGIGFAGNDPLGPAPARGRRPLPPSMSPGVPTHTGEQARQAEREGADYVAVGSIFPTATKPEFQLVGLDLLREVRGQIRAPLVAIGGITVDNAAQVVEAGADGVAVISAVCGAPDPAEATRRLLERIRPSLTARDRRL